MFQWLFKYEKLEIVNEVPDSNLVLKVRSGMMERTCALQLDL